MQRDQRCQYLAMLCNGIMWKVGVWETDLSLEVSGREIYPSRSSMCHCQNVLLSKRGRMCLAW